MRAMSRWKRFGMTGFQRWWRGWPEKDLAESGPAAHSDKHRFRVIHPLLEEPLVVALPSRHLLAQGDDGAPALPGLADETFIVYAREHGPAIYEATMAARLGAGFRPRLGQEAPRITVALSLVAAGAGQLPRPGLHATDGHGRRGVPAAGGGRAAEGIPDPRLAPR